MAALAVSATCRAVVVSGGDGQGNTNAPSGLAEWDNVGRFNVGEGSAVYLGNRWLLTAWHVRVDNNPSQVLLAGTWYGLDTNTWTRITNASGSAADMVMVRLSNSPPLGDVTLRSTQIPDDASLVMVGYGRSRHPTNSYWDASWNEIYSPPYTWTGFKMFLGFNAKRWGSNTVDNAFKNVDVASVPYSSITRSFRVTFTEGASADEAQAVIGDSGGAAFYWNGTAWELVGMMHNISVQTGQPWPGTVVYGNRTWAANLTTPAYYDQLVAAIPEPATMAFWAVAVAVGGFVIRRFRRPPPQEGGPADG